MVVFALVLLVLFTMIFDLSVLTSIRKLLLFHSVCRLCILLTGDATHKVNFISESQVRDRSDTCEYGDEVVLEECLLNYLLKEKVKQEVGEQASLTYAH
ncbi:hypothetical protein DPMN_113024 [Dreissena polymorpha]|uniref:Uncharacterized protein n=1 Tax=Dreissena polymorpha TaxID=45954 RepID=A0A9D4KHZ6_DREPO|nr:hypothetical protein DPMN_113024 [Dreissena polymorpha]